MNLIHALKTLQPESRPHLLIFSLDDSDFELVKEIGYEPASFHRIKPYHDNGLIRAANRLSRFVLKKNVWPLPKINKSKVDVLFNGPNSTYFRDISQRLYWIPDFQEHYLKDFFKPGEGEARIRKQKELADSGNHIVFSSKDAENDFQKFFHENNCTTHKVNFAVFHPDFSSLKILDLLVKYGIDQPYYIAPNQFWRHKNQICILEALRILSDQDKAPLVVFTGKEHDHRSSGYFEGLVEFVEQHSLKDNVRFLGFIDRGDQLCLMKHALAVIQPSLFEGWSTVVEDAKAMNQRVIASDLKVHHEQLGNQAAYFDPSNPQELADILSQSDYPVEVNFNYDNRLAKFGSDFSAVLSQIPV
jgi:glycosyltransferase involved in cell wall biosynthesis